VLTFALAATLMTLGAMGLVLLALRPRATPAAAAQARRQLNIAVLRQQLDELAREHAEGRLSQLEYTAAREDLQRRLLGDVQPEVHNDPEAGTRMLAPHRPQRALLAAAGVLPVAALALYLAAGSPQRLQATPAAPASGAVDQLQQHVDATPGDARAWVLLARARLEADRFSESAAAYERAVALSPKVARDPQIWCEWADAIALQQGSLRGRPQQLVERALALDPLYPRALDMAGSAAVEARDYRAAERYWRPLLGQLDPASAEHAQLAAALDKLARLAQPDRGPTAATR
jgi:cytochrome c-type biogenesis protein CcmH